MYLSVALSRTLWGSLYRTHLNTDWSPVSVTERCIATSTHVYLILLSLTIGRLQRWDNIIIGLWRNSRHYALQRLSVCTLWPQSYNSCYITARIHMITSSVHIYFISLIRESILFFKFYHLQEFLNRNMTTSLYLISTFKTCIEITNPVHYSEGEDAKQNFRPHFNIGANPLLPQACAVIQSPCHPKSCN